MSSNSGITENADLLAAMNGAVIHSPYHNGQIKIVGNTLIKDNEVIAFLITDDEVALLWQEFCYQNNFIPYEKVK